MNSVEDIAREISHKHDVGDGLTSDEHDSSPQVFIARLSNRDQISARASTTSASSAGPNKPSGPP